MGDGWELHQSRCGAGPDHRQQRGRWHLHHPEASGSPPPACTAEVRHRARRRVLLHARPARTAMVGEPGCVTPVWPDASKENLHRIATLSFGSLKETHMLIDVRTYRVRPNKMPQELDLYAKHGLAPQVRHL